MTIESYSDLLGEIVDHLASEELDAKAALFVQFAEARFKRLLDTLPQEVRAQQTVDEGQQFITIPNFFAGLRRLTLETEDREVVLKYLSPRALGIKYDDLVPEEPRDFTIEGPQIKLGPIPDAAYTLLALYTRDIRPLGLAEEEQTNFLLIRAPDLYLYQSLVAAEGYLIDDERMVIWKALADQGIQELIRWDRDNRTPADVATVHDVPQAFIEHG